MFLANKGSVVPLKILFRHWLPRFQCIPSCWGSVCFQQPHGTVFVSPLFQIFPQMSLHVFATGQAMGMTACTFFLSGLTRFTLWYNTQDAVHVASKFSWRCYQAEMSRFHIAPRECMSHAQNWSRLYELLQAKGLDAKNVCFDQFADFSAGLHEK